MMFIEVLISIICIVVMLIIAIMSEEKLKVTSLLFSFLFALNSASLMFHYLEVAQGATDVSYLFIFSLNAEQIIHLFRLSIVISLVSFTVFTYLSYYKKE
ncbi:hypothetical protein [Cohnella thermotolerans]|uniref:hypothetical protein n=1 Tax=Cohnella thermotolerans TaxID=329858 RepID=UPI0003F7704A|nr:hypothetical protein [Cohnella thermotolerans]